MIVKNVPNRRDGKSSFKALGKYITSGIQQSGDNPERTSWDHLTQYIVADSALDSLGEKLEKTIGVEAGNVHCLATAAMEMHAAASRCLTTDNPVMHLILSWPEGERPEASKIFAASRDMIAALGLSEHQYIVAIHDNTENRHAHIEVNRVHPRTFRPARLAWLNRTMHRAAREIEIKYGWLHDKGLFEVIEVNGEKHVIDKRDVERVRRSFGANRAEMWSGAVSLESWCRGEPAQALRDALASDSASWDIVHQTLAAFGLELRDSGGGGMRVHALDAAATVDGPMAVSASKAFRFLKRVALEERFGAFTPPRPDAAPAAPSAGPKRDPEKRLVRRLERQAGRQELVARFRTAETTARETRAIALEVLRDEFKATDAADRAKLQSDYKAMRVAIGSDKSLGHEQRRQAYMVSQMTYAKAREQYRLVTLQRRAERRAIVPTVPNWRDWVTAQAVQGDDEAIKALRGMTYQDRREGLMPLIEPEPEFGSIAPSPSQPTDPQVRDILRLTWKVSTHGTVTYILDNRTTAFVDAGPKIRFGQAVLSDDALRMALRYAADKWDGEIKLHGGDRVFRARLARMANQMGIELANPDLRVLQRQDRLLQEVKPTALPHINPEQQRGLMAAKLSLLNRFNPEFNDGNHSYPDPRRAFQLGDQAYSPVQANTHAAGGFPQAETLRGLRSLSRIPLARHSGSAEVLLPDHAPHQLGLDRAAAPDALRRDGHRIGGSEQGLNTALLANPERTHRGALVGIDVDFVYQQTRAGLVKHPRAGLTWPDVGAAVTVKYARGTPSSATQTTERPAARRGR